MSEWTQACCNACYQALHGEYPVRVKGAEIETCVYCGDRTGSGIYIRLDPKVVDLLGQERVPLSALMEHDLHPAMLERRGFVFNRSLDFWEKNHVKQQ